MEEAIRIGTFTKGSFTYDFLGNMDFDNYENLIKKVNKLIEETSPK